MPKYTCRKCGTECYGCILYTLRACGSCGALIHRQDVLENWDRAAEPSSESPSSFPGKNEKAGWIKLLQFE